MSENLSYRLDKRHGWGTPYEPQVLAIETFVYSAGWVTFVNGQETAEVNILLLEFYLEIQTALFRHFGSSEYEHNIDLLVSGDRMTLCRSRERVLLKDGDRELLNMPWSEFIDDVSRFSARLKEDVRVHFPAMSQTPEFKLFFSQD